MRSQPRGQKIPHFAVELETKEENRIVYGDFYWKLLSLHRVVYAFCKIHCPPLKPYHFFPANYQ